MSPQEGIAKARREAQALLRRFGLAESAQHADVEALAASLNIKIVGTPLEGAEAQLVVSGHRAKILISDRLTSPTARRAAIAHELGHYCLSHPSTPTHELCGPTSPTHAVASGERDLEHEANVFALELLAPTGAVRRACSGRPITVGLAAHLSVICWIPIELAAIRICELSDRMCAALGCTPNGITWVAPSPSFLESFGAFAPRPGRPLDVHSQAWRVLVRGEVREPGLVAASAWLDLPSELPLVEHTVPIDGSGGALTMLWASKRELSRTAVEYTDTGRLAMLT